MDGDILREFINSNDLVLKPTQATLCAPIVFRIYKKMHAGIQFPPIKIIDGLICDGHHRYIASVLAGVALDTVPGSKTSATDVNNWESITFDNEDWDTLDEIARWNKQDAEFNNISFEQLVALLE